MGKEKKKKVELIILFSMILLICVASLYIAIYTQFYKKDTKEASNENTIDAEQVKLQELEDNKNKMFDNLFENKIKQDNNEIEKQDSEKELVYTDYYKKEETEKFEIDVSIPKINLKEAETINNKIYTIFIQKAEAIQHEEKDTKSVYSIKYTANVVDNILSIAIDARLKENDEPQRRMVETYNFNMETKKEISLEELINDKNLDKDEIQNKVKETIKKSNEEADKFSNMGYEVYRRDLRSDIYDIENIKNFYYDSDDILYIIFAYGNSETTTEKDIVIYKK